MPVSMPVDNEFTSILPDNEQKLLSIENTKPLFNYILDGINNNNNNNNNNIESAMLFGTGTNAARQIGLAENAASGISSHAEGHNTVANGSYSHTEGSNTIASKQDSHAEGNFTTANGTYSHAEGRNSIASGESSHAEGFFTKANGQSSHAENYSTIANDFASHAEGYLTTANGNSSHAEGYNTIANGGYGHAEGCNTRANGNGSHAEGWNTIADGIISHAEGNNTIASGYYSHSEGYNTLASGTNSHAEGCNTIANGHYSHAEGYKTLANKNYSHAEGNFTTANGQNSHAEGYVTIANGEGSHAEGSNTTASGTYSHTEGFFTIANGQYQHVSGKYNIEDTENEYAEIIGNGTKNNGQITRSNARTLDWNGNEWLAGDLTVNVNNTEHTIASLLQRIAALEANSSGNGSSGGGGESSEDTIWIELSYTSTLNHFDTNISFNEIQSLLNEGKCDIRVHFDPSGNGYANTVWHLSNWSNTIITFVNVTSAWGLQADCIDIDENGATGRSFSSKYYLSAALDTTAVTVTNYNTSSASKIFDFLDGNIPINVDMVLDINGSSAKHGYACLSAYNANVKIATFTLFLGSDIYSISVSKTEVIAVNKFTANNV